MRSAWTITGGDLVILSQAFKNNHFVSKVLFVDKAGASS